VKAGRRRNRERRRFTCKVIKTRPAWSTAKQRPIASRSGLPGPLVHRIDSRMMKPPPFPITRLLRAASAFHRCCVASAALSAGMRRAEHLWTSLAEDSRSAHGVLTATPTRRRECGLVTAKRGMLYTTLVRCTRVRRRQRGPIITGMYPTSLGAGAHGGAWSPYPRGKKMFPQCLKRGDGRGRYCRTTDGGLAIASGQGCGMSRRRRTRTGKQQRTAKPFFAVVN